MSNNRRPVRALKTALGRGPLVLAAVLVASWGLAEQARLELNGRARLERPDGGVQSYTRSGGPALALSLGAGDRLCVTEGRGRLVYGVKAFSLEARGAACFEVARPRSLWQNLVTSCQDIGVCKRQAEAAFAKEAKSRGPEGSVPALYLPTDYGLAALTLAVGGGQSLRLLDEARELLALEAGADGLFAVPTEALRRAGRLEVRNASGVTVYAAPVRWVNLEHEFATAGPREAALALMTTAALGYAPAAYSYLLAAGDAELARVLEAQIRAEFRGTAR